MVAYQEVEGWKKVGREKVLQDKRREQLERYLRAFDTDLANAQVTHSNSLSKVYIAVKSVK